MPVAQHLTAEEYLASESRSPIRHELVGGVLYAMVGGTRRHNQVAGRFFRLVADAAEAAGCRPYIADMKVRAADSFYYPDVMVACEDVDGHPLYEAAPCLVVEVLSPSTTLVDRREKLGAYLSLPSLRAYVLVDPERQQVEVHDRVNGRWVARAYGAGDAFPLTCPPVTIDVDRLYA